MLSPDFELSRLGFEGSSELYEWIQKTGKLKTVRKGETIIRAGSAATFLIYVKSGIFKTVIKGPRKDFILAFTFQDDIDCCPRSLLNKLPNNFNVEAITPAEVLVCNIEALKKEAGKHEFQNMAASILNHYAGFLETQLVEFFTLTAEQRYHKLREAQPEKIRQVPLALLASYLGITQERLSRIRKGKNLI